MTGSVEWEQPPPHSLDAERAVLGSILLDPTVIAAVSSIVTEADFYRGEHRAIFRAMRRLYERGQPADFPALIEFLSSHRRGDRDWLAEIGGGDYLRGLADGAPTAVYANHHAETVARHSARRRMIEAGQAIVRQSYDPGLDIDQLMIDATAAVQAVAADLPGQDWTSLTVQADRSWDRLGERMEERLPFGILDLDAKIGGMLPGQLIIPAARPGSGKSAFCIQTALAAARHGKRVAIMSLEMGADEIMDRLVALQSGVNLFAFKRRAERDQRDWDGIAAALGVLHDLPILIDDRVKATIDDVITRARRMKAVAGLDLLIVDYVQLLGTARRVDNRVQELSRVTRGLKQLARELKIPILAPSQLNRESESRDSGRPQLSDLRESGSLEQDADLVIFIHWPWIYNPGPSNPENVAQFIVAKHRNGPIGEVPALWRPELARFDPLARTSERAA